MKKRYQVTLSPERVDPLKMAIADLGLVQGAFSHILDDALLLVTPAYQRMAEKKKKGQQMTFEELAAELANVVREAGKP